MTEKECVESFNAELDKIVSGESDISTEYGHSNEESKELFFLAQLLAKADYTTGNQDRKERIWSKISRNRELEDDDLDLVAGGINPNKLLDEENKKMGI